MLDFARDTGLCDSSRQPRRYLWTDAFAVCNFLELYRQTGEASFLQTACELVAQVHRILGCYDQADPRSGWISGLEPEEGARHPTAGGLRIGKPLLERAPGQAMDERLEWERDGQYFHYLTRWMQALTRMAAETGESDYQRWALELARAAHRGFSYRPAAGGPLRMHWKVSVDLSRPLVASMGQHDPLDALVTYRELAANSDRYDFALDGLELAGEIADCQELCAHGSWATDDPLGIGGLLVDTLRLAQVGGGVSPSEPVQLSRLLADCEVGLAAFLNSTTLNAPARHRLAFRELGLATGLKALARLRDMGDLYPHDSPLVAEYASCFGQVSRFILLGDVIEKFWCQPVHQQVASWREHLDINRVMLATCLTPDAYLFAVPCTPMQGH